MVIYLEEAVRRKMAANGCRLTIENLHSAVMERASAVAPESHDGRDYRRGVIAHYVVHTDRRRSDETARGARAGRNGHVLVRRFYPSSPRRGGGAIKKKPRSIISSRRR